MSNKKKGYGIVTLFCFEDNLPLTKLVEPVKSTFSTVFAVQSFGEGIASLLKSYAVSFESGLQQRSFATLAVD